MSGSHYSYSPSSSLPLANHIQYLVLYLDK
uniref:Uncharacterized protein n=1 Tax=Rhizophora mucronata TaxID=61149 RepID=A0A2P2II79_RHIMU